MSDHLRCRIGDVDAQARNAHAGPNGPRLERAALPANEELGRRVGQLAAVAPTTSALANHKVDGAKTHG